MLRTISHLLPMFLQMLKDEFPDVRLHIISKLESVNKGEDWTLYFKVHELSDFFQLLELSFYQKAFCLQLSSLRRTRHGASGKLSLNIYPFFPNNSANHSSMNNWAIYACRGWVTPSTASGRPRRWIWRTSQRSSVSSGRRWRLFQRSWVWGHTPIICSGWPPFKLSLWEF